MSVQRLKEIIVCVRTDNSTPSPLSNQSQWEAWVEYVRTFQPFTWFVNLTFRTDILSYAQENPKTSSVKYEFKDNTGKYLNGTYVRTYRTHRVNDGGTYKSEFANTERWCPAGKWNTSKTYVRTVQEEHANRMYRRWARKLNEEVFGTRFRDRGQGLLHVYAVEYQKRGVAHLHSLVKDVPSHVSRIQYEKLWRGLHPNNGFANIYPYDPERGAAGYLAKYVLKGGMVDIIAPAGLISALRANIDFGNNVTEKGSLESPPGASNRAP